MTIDTYQELWNKLLLRAPALSPKLAQDFIINAFRRLAEHRRWSWLVKFGQFISPAVCSTGTVTVTQNSATVTGSGTTFTSDMVGRQFRTGASTPIYTIASFVNATTITLDAVWGGTTASAQTYSIYTCFFTPPSDFHQFICLWDPSFNWQLGLDINQSEINMIDAQRANVGNSYCVSFRDYTTSQVGIVGSALQVVGTGPDPTSSGTFTGPVSAVFTIEITTGGAAGTAVYKWKKDSGSYTTGVATNGTNTAQSLQDGVQVTFPTAVTYIVGDTWVVQATAVSNAGLPRYELWPHQQADHCYPFLYEARIADLDETNAVLPRYIRGDVLVEMALEDLCLWPGPSKENPNIYYSLRNAAFHASRISNGACTGMLDILERQDDEVWEQQLTYLYPQVSWGLATPLGDSRWLQSHAI